jgi:hypothetical protein
MAKKMATVRVHIIRRVPWEYNEEFHERFPHEAGEARGISFRTAEKAESFRLQRERESRGWLNPFEFGGLGDDLNDYSTLSPDEFGELVGRIGWRRPSRGRAFSWLAWFDGWEGMTQEQRHAIWDALDLVRFFDITPLRVPLEGGASPDGDDRLFLVEKRIDYALDADARRGPLPHLARMTQEYDGRADLVYVNNFEFHEGYHPLRAFRDDSDAEAFCKTLEDDAWQGINPFRFGRREEWTSLDAGRLRDMMLDIGLEPPAGKFDTARWRKWYDVASATATELQRLGVRQALDRLHFFRVTELTA